VRPVFISVDVEVTDTDPVHGRLMQVGMVSDSGEALNYLFPVKNTAKTSEWVAENLPGLLKSCWQKQFGTKHLPRVHRLEQGGSPPGTVNAMFYTQVRDMHDWVMHQRYVATPDRDRGILGRIPPAVMVCYCGGLDFGFTTRAFAHCGMESPFHYEFVEISSLAMGKLNLPWGFTGTELEDALGIPPMEEGTKHDALADALHQLKIFNKLMEIP
jgi:hypothetical protein